MSTTATITYDEKGRPTWLPYMPVKRWRNPVAWLKTFIYAKLLFYIPAFYMALPIGIATYWLLTQTTETVDNAWHDLVPDKRERNIYRNVPQTMFAALFASMFIFDRYKIIKKMHEPLGRWDKIEIACGVPNIKDKKPFSIGQIFLTAFYSFIYGLPLFFVTTFAALYIQRNSGSVPWLAELLDMREQRATTSFWTEYGRLLTTDWDFALIGFIPAYFWARRPARGFYDDVQGLVVKRLIDKDKTSLHWYYPPGIQNRLYVMTHDPEAYAEVADFNLDLLGMFVKRRIQSGKPLRKWHYPAYRARYRNMLAHPETAPERVNKWLLFTVYVCVGTFLFLEGVGWFVFFFIIP